MKVTITGGTGFVGRRLVPRLLEEGREVRILGRSAKTGIAPEVDFYLWDATQSEPPRESLEDADAIVHLAGESAAQRWSPEIRRRIRSSRLIRPNKRSDPSRAARLAGWITATAGSGRRRNVKASERRKRIPEGLKGSR